jgi:hypothetical protein
MSLLALVALFNPSAALASSTLITPPDGSSNVPTNVTFQWTSSPNVQAYYLYVGTTPGDKDVVDTGETMATTYGVSFLPDALTLYARMWTKQQGVWTFVDSTFQTAAVRPTLLQPADGSTGVPTVTTFQWTTVPSALAYYVYVGTTPGGKDVIDSGELPQTSLAAHNLPQAQTLYVRLWSKLPGAWYYRDSMFTTARETAQLISPANGGTIQPISATFQWTPVPNVQAYYLYVGTTPGAKDVVDTGEVQVTAYAAPALPEGRTLYARLWTKRSTWQFTDSTFSTTVMRSVITSPANGSQVLPLTVTFQWTTVAGAKAYYLYVGTSVGAKDIVDTGELAGTSVTVGSLPAGTTLYLRMWTKGDQWLFTDTTIQTNTLMAQLQTPADGTQNVPLNATFSWNVVPAATVYYLYVGTAPGLKDVVDSGEIVSTSYSAVLPEWTPLYASLSTKVGGVWRSTTSSFKTAPVRARLTFPADRAIGVDLTQPFSWTPVPGATAYRLRVFGQPDGTEPYADSGETLSTSFVPLSLPADRPLYARLFTQTVDGWVFSDAVFTAQASVGPSTMIYPTGQSGSIAASVPFSWQPVALAMGYRLRIGTTLGGADLHDSGTITFTKRLVPNLPTGVELFGSIDTKLAGNWTSSTFSFTVSDATISNDQRIGFAQILSADVRHMADFSNQTTIGSGLALITGSHHDLASCWDYAEALLAVAGDANFSLPIHRLTIGFLDNQFDVHALDELWDADSGAWIVLDPTFGLMVQRASDGGWATAEDIQASTAAQDWNALRYIWTTAEGNAYASQYYIDYPLLYLTIVHPSFMNANGPSVSPLPFLEPLSPPVSGDTAVFTLGCDGAQTATAIIDGVSTTVSCGSDSFSHGFFASSIVAPPDSQAVVLFRFRRFVF